MVKDYVSLGVIFAGTFVTGLGGCFYYCLGVPYADDNISKNNGPLMLGIVWASRLLGPAIGFVLGSACLRVYTNPDEDVEFGEKDPR